MINRTILVGRITRDPELKKTQSGKSVVSFTLAVNRKFSKEGEDNADFINCVAWNQTAEFMDNYVTKGQLLGVEGRIQVRNYEDNTGRKVYVTEILCDSVQSLESRNQRQERENNSNMQEESELMLDVNEDLPF